MNVVEHIMTAYKALAEGDRQALFMRILEERSLSLGEISVKDVPGVEVFGVSADTKGVWAYRTKSCSAGPTGLRHLCGEWAKVAADGTATMKDDDGKHQPVPDGALLVCGVKGLSGPTVVVRYRPEGSRPHAVNTANGPKLFPMGDLIVSAMVRKDAIAKVEEYLL